MFTTKEIVIAGAAVRETVLNMFGGRIDLDEEDSNQIARAAFWAVYRARESSKTSK